LLKNWKDRTGEMQLQGQEGILPTAQEAYEHERDRRISVGSIKNRAEVLRHGKRTDNRAELIIKLSLSKI